MVLKVLFLNLSTTTECVYMYIRILVYVCGVLLTRTISDCYCTEIPQQNVSRVSCWQAGTGFDFKRSRAYNNDKYIVYSNSSEWDKMNTQCSTIHVV